MTYRENIDMLEFDAAKQKKILYEKRFTDGAFEAMSLAPSSEMFLCHQPALLSNHIPGPLELVYETVSEYPGAFGYLFPSCNDKGPIFD